MSISNKQEVPIHDSKDYSIVVIASGWLVFFPQLKTKWCLMYFRVVTLESAGVCRSQLAKRIDYFSIPMTNGNLLSILTLWLTPVESQICCLTEMPSTTQNSRVLRLSRAAWHPHLLASIKQTYRNPLTCIAAKWPYGGALHLKPYTFLSRLFSVQHLWDPWATNGEWQRRPCALSSALCLTFYCHFAHSVVSWGELESVCACVCAKVPLLLSCSDVII